MVLTSKLTVIGVIVISIVIGFLSFNLFSNLSKEERKLHNEELFSLLVNFVICIWIGKIILHFSTFVSDPFSVLAYPSDSNAFYFAIVLTTILFLRKLRFKNMKALPVVVSLVHIFLISAFVYEFNQLFVGDNPYAFWQVGLLTMLISLFFILKERLNLTTFLITIVTHWSLGMIILSFVQPFVTVFGYLVAPWFVCLLFMLSIGITYLLRRRDVNGNY